MLLKEQRPSYAKELEEEFLAQTLCTRSCQERDGRKVVSVGCAFGTRNVVLKKTVQQLQCDLMNAQINVQLLLLA